MASKRTPEASSSSSATPRWNQEVFLSFRGEDTRTNFTGHLYTALVQKGINTFIDDKLKKGEEISPELLKAIEESRIAIILFSKDYASSSWCLNELVKILECKKTKGQMVMPIFYDVNPSDVRKQNGIFAKSFARHEKRFKLEMEKVQKWRAALTEASNLSGFYLRDANGHESKFIQRIVEDVWTKLNPTTLNVAIYPVGIDSRVADVMSLLLKTRSDDVRTVGIYGMGGIGKTTIAKAIFNRLIHRFEGSSFLANVREVSKQHDGLVHLQKQLLCDILMEKELHIINEHSGINLINKRLQCKRVLVVLDDVNDVNQVNALAGERNWFGWGSRIIITTRDQHILDYLQVDGRYEVEILNRDESLQLFSWHAFRKDHPFEDYVELSKNVANYAGGTPLALEVLGSLLFGRSTAEWKSQLEKLKVIPHDEIQKKLQISFEDLDKIEKDIFLDIACFFNGMDTKHVIRILDGCNFFSEIGINKLNQRSLIKIDTDLKLRMHDLLQDMGRKIVNEENMELGKRSRLWSNMDVLHVLKENMGTEAVEGLILDLTALEDKQLSTKTFAKMRKLRLLQVNHVRLIGDYKHLPKDLRWLCWDGFPLRSIPTNFHLENLVTLDMQNSNVREVYKGFKALKNLKFLNLSNSHYLTKTPDFSKFPCLERLILESCTSLVEVDQSIGQLDKLVFLNLKDCKNLRILPSSLPKLKSLEINLSGCPKLFQKKEFSTELHANGTAIKQRPNFCSSLSSRKNTSIALPPASILCLCSLKMLELRDCNLSDNAIPSDLGSLSSLEVLDLSQNENLCSLPTSLSHLSQLNFLNLVDCFKLQSLPELPSSLCRLVLTGCSSFKRANFSNCDWLTELNVNDYNTLVENQVIENLEALEVIWVMDEVCLDFIPTERRNSLAGFYQVLERAMDLNLGYWEVPEWFMYKSKKCSICFEVPATPSDGALTWLIVCVVLVFDQEAKGSADHRFGINVETDRFEFTYSRYVYMEDSKYDYVRMVHIPHNVIQNELKNGDRVEVSFEVSAKRFRVRECGVHLIYGPDEKDSQSYGEEIIQFTCKSTSASPYEYRFSYKRRGQTNSKRCLIDDDDMGPNSSQHNEEDPHSSSKRLRRIESSLPALNLNRKRPIAKIVSKKKKKKKELKKSLIGV